MESTDARIVLKYAYKLGFDDSMCKPWTGGEVQRYYEKKLKIAPKKEKK